MNRRISRLTGAAGFGPLEVSEGEDETTSEQRSVVFYFACVKVVNIKSFDKRPRAHCLEMD